MCFFKWFLILLILLNFLPALTRKYPPFCSELPVLVIWTKTKGPIKVSHPISIWLEKNLAFLEVFENADANSKNCLLDQPSYNSSVSIHIRGRSTQFVQKHQFAMYTYGHITPQQEALAKQGNLPPKVKIPLLGFTKGNNWVLNAPWFDKSYLRNVVGYKLASDGSRTWQPGAKFFELFLVTDGKNEIDESLDFQGLYVLIEKIKQDDDRVDINSMKPNDISPPYVTGGYIVAKDQSHIGDIVFPSLIGGLIVKTPDPEEISEPQKTYLKGALTHIFNAFNGYQCPTFGISYDKCNSFDRIPLNYADVLDLNSFVDYFLHSEISKNQDAYSNSRYLTKHIDSFDGVFGKWYSGPVWDLNLCFAASKIAIYKSVESWLYLSLSEIYRRLMKINDFVDLVVERWFILREEVWSISKIKEFYDTQKKLIQNSNAVSRDQKIWFPGVSHTIDFEVSSNELLNFITGRMKWIDNNICELYTTISQECFDDNDCPKQFLGIKCLCNKCRSIKISVTEPTDMSHWTLGKKEAIRWDTSVSIASIIPYVDIWLQNGSNIFLIANGTKNDQKNSWVVNDLVPVGTGYVICIQSSQTLDSIPSCSNMFEIHESKQHFLKLVYPNQASIWNANTHEEIHWMTYGLFNYVELFYQKDHSGNEVKFLTNVKNDGKTSWNVLGSLKPGTYSIIIREQITANNNVITQAMAKSNPFHINSWIRPEGNVNIIVTAPIQGAYLVGRNLPIRWEFSPDTTTIAVNIYIQKDDNAAERVLIISDTINDGKTTIFIPLIFNDSRKTCINYRIVVQDTGVPPIEGLSQLIELQNPNRTVKFLAPMEGQLLQIGTDQIIRWMTIGFTNDVDIFYSNSLTGKLNVIKKGANNDGIIIWSIPNTLSLGATYYLHILDSTPSSTARAINGPMILTTRTPTQSPTLSSSPTSIYQKEWIKCANADEDCPCTNVIRYHVNDEYSDDISDESITKCNADFCDCQVADWVFCANESHVCNCFGPVRYGACSDNKCNWVFISSFHNVKCSNDSFHNIRDDNVSKQCYCGGKLLHLTHPASNTTLRLIIAGSGTICVTIIVIIILYYRSDKKKRKRHPRSINMNNFHETLLSGYREKTHERSVPLSHW